MNAPQTAPDDRRSTRRVLLAGWLGTTIEFYDFFIYGTAAALVFPKLFFPQLGAAAGTAASFATFAVAFVARPLGGVLFGHIGDRAGRKTTLVATLLLMGLATVAIGLLPTGAVIGIWAPVLLIVFRFLQGLAVGGEWASAALFVGEYAPKDRRAVYALSPSLGTCSGLLLATLTFLASGTLLSTDAFESWGWRVPFLFSIVLVVVGLLVRLGIAETPVFRAAAARADRSRSSRAPLVELFRHQWREVILAAGASTMWLAFFYLGAVYLTHYGTTVLGLSRGRMLGVNLVAVVVCMAATIGGAVLADRFGRRKVMATVNALAVPWAFALFPLVDTGEVILVGLATSVTLMLVGFASGPTTAWLPEIFRTAYRSTGTGVSFNLGSVLAGAIPPILAAPILAAFGSVGLGAMMALIAALATVSVLRLRETVGTRLDDPAQRGGPTFQASADERKPSLQEGEP